MKKIISCILAFSMIFTGASVTSCFAQDKETNIEITSAQESPIILNFQISGGNANATSESKSEAKASSSSRAATIAKIVLAIILIFTVKKYTKIALNKILPELRNIKGKFTDVAKKLKELIESKLEKIKEGDTTVEKITEVNGEVMENNEAGKWSSLGSKFLRATGSLFYEALSFFNQLKSTESISTKKEFVWRHLSSLVSMNT